MNTSFRNNTKMLIVAAGLLFASCLPCSATTLNSENLVPLTGYFAGAGTEFSGNFTHLGLFAGTIDPATFTAQWTAANGDIVTNQTVSFSLIEEVAPGVFVYEQSMIITGGSGRFANATGWANVTGLFNVVTGEFCGDLDGKISMPNS